ncbi:hypothetical protein [Pseudobutyrivibrio sp.]|jgi:hypothetical protein|uniref:hypothetical protein n=1 Tax=Pseudobutyrivibrio sp. TaxID=2014367 RepID=UPI0025FDC81C|nr:hypothetical protein [Pseudobutyrivibrio sp.]
MGKKQLTELGTVINFYLKQNLPAAEIAKRTGISIRTIYYYKKRPEELPTKERHKIPKKYIEEIYKLASNKTTNQMSGGAIANKINEKLKKKNIRDTKGEILTISKSQVNRILRKKYGSPRKIKKTFYLTDEQKQKRVKFCKEILKKGIKGKNIFFTDETKIDTSPFTVGEYIRLSSRKKKQIKKGEEEALELVSRPQKKFEPSIMLAGGISYYGLSDLILLNGNMNKFSYGQALDFYKKNYDKFSEKKKNLFFEQDGARCHTHKKILVLMEKMFGDKIIQNSPNSPDLAYPIETLWAELKKRVKKRNPKNVEDLKKYSLEEWNGFSKEYIKNQFKNFLKRCRKIIEIKGRRLEPVHLQQIRNEEESEENEEESEENEEENKEEEKLKLKLIYDEKNLEKKCRDEMKLIRRKINIKKKMNKKFKKELKKMENFNKRKKIVTDSLKKKKIRKRFKDIELQNLIFKINWLKKMLKNWFPKKKAKKRGRKKKEDIEEKKEKEEKEEKMEEEEEIEEKEEKMEEEEEIKEEEEEEIEEEEEEKKEKKKENKKEKNKEKKKENKNKEKKEEEEEQEGECKKYYDYFKKQCEVKELEKTKASTNDVDDGNDEKKITNIINKRIIKVTKTKEQKKIEEDENNFYTFDYNPNC